MSPRPSAVASAPSRVGRRGARPPSPGAAPEAQLPSWARRGRLAARLGFGAALAMATAQWCQDFYRHFAHTKSFSLWLLVSFGLVGALAAWRPRGIGAEGPREARWFRLALLATVATWALSLTAAVNVGKGLEEWTKIVPIFAVAWWAAQRPLAWRRDTPWALGLMFCTTAVVLVLGLLQWDRVQTRFPADIQVFFRDVMGLLRHDRMLATLGNANSAAAFYSSALALMAGVLTWDRVAWRPWAALAAMVALGLLLWKTPWFVSIPLLILLCVAAGWIGLRARDHSLRWRLLAVLLGACLIFALMATNSRGGKVSAAAGLAAAIVMWVGWHRRLNRWVTWGATALMLITLVAWVIWLGWLAGATIEQVLAFDQWAAELWQRVMSALGLPAGKHSFQDRLWIWQSAAQMVRDYPWLGVGYSNFPVIYPLYTVPLYYDLWPPTALITTEEAHSGHINIAVETGIVGSIPWAAVLLIAWFGAMRRLRWASEGDEASRAVLIWFAPAMALVAHMAVDKFMVYPASLTLLMWCLGQMVRPRAGMAEPAEARAANRRWASAVWAVGMAVAVVAAFPSMQLAMASHALAEGRLFGEQARDVHEALRQVTSPAQRSRYAALFREVSRQAELALERCRTRAPWEIDAWTRSLDFRTVTRGIGEDPLTNQWLRQAILVSPNYYPVQRNLATLLADRWQSAGRPADSPLLDQALRLLDHALRLRPNDINSLFQAAQVLEMAGHLASAEARLEELLAIPGLDHYVPEVALEARNDLARLHSLRGASDQAVGLLESALERAEGTEAISLWVRIAVSQIAAGHVGAAWRDLAARIEGISPREAEQLLARLEDPRAIQPTAYSLAIVGLLATGQGEQAAALVTPRAGSDASLTDWLFAAVVARMVSEDLARDVLASAEAAFPGEAAVASAEAELLGG